MFGRHPFGVAIISDPRVVDENIHAAEAAEDFGDRQRNFARLGETRLLDYAAALRRGIGNGWPGGTTRVNAPLSRSAGGIARLSRKRSSPRSRAVPHLSR